LPNNVDDELEEIRKLISDADPTAPSAPISRAPQRPSQGVPMPHNRPEHPNTEADFRAPQLPSQGVPIPYTKPKHPDTGADFHVSAPVPVRSRGAKPPSRVSRPVPVIKKNPVEEYDISSTGNISKSGEVIDVTEFDITQSGKVSKHRDRPPVPEPELDIGNEDFKINFDFDGEYQDVPEEKPIRIRREKRTGCVGGIMYAAFIICISLTLASLLWMATVDVLGFGAVDEQVNVTIPHGFEMSDVTDILYGAGLIRHRVLFNMYADFSNAEERIIPGTFVLNKNFDYRALVQGMTARAGVREEVTVTIPEGFTLLQIFTLMEDHGVVHSADDLWEAATYHDFEFHFLDEDTLGDRFRLEGFLFPNTYNFFKSSSPTSVLNRLLREFDRRFTEEYVERAEEMGLSIHDIINIAAMVEREAANDEERPRIAAVIYNRLASPQFPNLEIDATLSYAVQGTDQIATTTLDHPFNTYIHPGLPPWPIANPGIASIRAALFPLENTNEYFYALHVDGTHRFFSTYPEHRAFVQSEDFGRWW